MVPGMCVGVVQIRLIYSRLLPYYTRAASDPNGPIAWFPIIRYPLWNWSNHCILLYKGKTITSVSYCGTRTRLLCRMIRHGRSIVLLVLLHTHVDVPLAARLIR